MREQWKFFVNRIQSDQVCGNRERENNQTLTILSLEKDQAKETPTENGIESVWGNWPRGKIKRADHLAMYRIHLFECSVKEKQRLTLSHYIHTKCDSVTDNKNNRFKKRENEGMEDYWLYSRFLWRHLLLCPNGDQRPETKMYHINFKK